MKVFILTWVAMWYSAFMIYVFYSMLFNGVYFLHEYNDIILYCELSANVFILIFAVYCFVNWFRRLKT